MARTKDPELQATDDFGPAMAGLIAPRWERVWAALDRIGKGDDAEAIHDVRVASRRLRAAMEVAADCFPAQWYASLHRTAKDITAALGAVRDRDVLLIALNEQRAAADPNDIPALDALIAQVESERRVARREMREFLAVLESSGARAESRRRFASAASKGAR
ncbi:MAG TPA: CHAD domain-containing protein [Thermomicrobiales bacterium]|jgi:CHAD domain-containing protein|nr:CHAD domain-containing protein [Thermomicrobiales bacterium]